jgi:uroporphyrinogen-III decarboxylase
MSEGYPADENGNPVPPDEHFGFDMVLDDDIAFDALNTMQVSAGCDVVRFAEKYSDKIAFIGGLDTRILESGDRKKIKHKITEMLNALRALKTRYVFGSDHSISTNVSYGDFKYAIEVYKDNMTY